jgi:endoglucanase
MLLLALALAMVGSTAAPAHAWEPPWKYHVHTCRALDRPVPPQLADPRGVAPDAPNPLTGVRFFLDRHEKSWFSWRWLLRTGHPHQAAAMERVAVQPKFRWWGRFTRPRMPVKVRNYLKIAQCRDPGSVPLMTVMRHQGKQCGKGYTGGDRREDARARSFYRGFARAVREARVVIVFEPDALGTLECLAKTRRRARLRLMRYGIDRLSRLPNATIYIDAGASDWESAARTAKLLRRVGVSHARGFALNVTHYDWTASNIAHGREISRLIGGKPFIVSTAFNGRGPVHVRKRRGHRVLRLNVWCHPLKRGLGPVPTTVTGFAKVDAFLWVGRPGYSAGACNGGPARVGAWWRDRALMFGAYATNWLRRPPETRFGLFRRYSARRLGYCGRRCT